MNTYGTTIRVLINGEEVTFDKEISVAELLANLGLPARGVAVERNLEIVPSAKFPTVILKNQDSLEIVTLVGGG